jgi:hypothetical protein
MCVPVFDVHAISREVELFDKGYAYYLSYQPDRAAEEFRQFIKEFPGSSAVDAAMYWLAKSLIQLKASEEAKKIFFEIRDRYPMSPFNKYIEKEIENISLSPKDEKIVMDLKTDPGTIAVPEAKLKDAEERAVRAENLLKTAAGERDSLKQYLEAERKRIDGLQKEISECEKKIVYAKTSASVLNTLGIGEVAWGSGNVMDDYLNEQILLDKAKQLNLSPDMKTYEAIVEVYKFDSKQAEYVLKLLTISSLIDVKLKDMQDEKVFEKLFVTYDGSNAEKDKYTKIAQSTELQKLAKEGVSFQEIQRLYSSVVQFAVIGFEEMDPSVKETIQSLRTGEIGVIWSANGYIIIKPVLRKRSFDLFETLREDKKILIQSFIHEWLQQKGEGK